MEKQQPPKTKRMIPPRKKPKPHFRYIGTDYGQPVICRDDLKDITVELYHIPIEALDFLDIWMKNLIEMNGGHGEITLQLKDGLFHSASATETFRFVHEKNDAPPPE